MQQRRRETVAVLNLRQESTQLFMCAVMLPLRSGHLDSVGVFTVHNIMLQSEWFRCRLVFCGGRSVSVVQLGLLRSGHGAGMCVPRVVDTWWLDLHIILLQSGQ